MMKFRVAVAATSAVVLGVGALSITPASAAARPSVTLHIARVGVTHNTPLRVSASYAHLPSHTRLYLQRGFGTRAVYRYVQKLPAGNRVVSSAGVPQGRYVYRVVAVLGRRQVAVSPIRSVYSYGPVSAAQLCSRSEHSYFSGGCGLQSVQVGSHVFQSQAQASEGNTGPDGNPDVTAIHSSCRSVSLSYAVSNDAAADGVTQLGAALTQTSADEQNGTGSPNSVATATFAIRSSAWDLEFWSDSEYEDVYWSATFDCWSSTGDN